jgi:hypothetical protein
MKPDPNKPAATNTWTSDHYAMFRFATIICLCALTACSKSSAPKNSVYEVTGSSTERVARVSAIITKNKAAPTAIVDARFMEEQTGDGSLGPSDFRAFYFVQVAPQKYRSGRRSLRLLGQPQSIPPQHSLVIGG